MFFEKFSILFYFHFFVLLVLLSLQSYAGGDPDDFAQEEEQVTKI